MEYDRVTVRERGTDRLLTIQQVEIPKSLPHFEFDNPPDSRSNRKRRSFGMSGVDVADVPPLRLMSTTQGEETNPHVVAKVHMLPGLVSEQMYLLFLPCCALAAKKPAINIPKNRSEPHQMATRCCTFIAHLT
jgi:hypothetical protein